VVVEAVGQDGAGPNQQAGQGDGQAFRQVRPALCFTLALLFCLFIMCFYFVYSS
jgi:hypothetical protein